MRDKVIMQLRRESKSNFKILRRFNSIENKPTNYKRRPNVRCASSMDMSDMSSTSHENSEDRIRAEAIAHAANMKRKRHMMIKPRITVLSIAL
jgi:hypothetical protein